MEVHEETPCMINTVCDSSGVHHRAERSACSRSAEWLCSHQWCTRHH